VQPQENIGIPASDSTKKTMSGVTSGSTTWTCPAIVVNPTKVDDLESHREMVDALFDTAGLPVPRWYTTTEDDPGRGQTQQALDDGADLVIAHGGDGTVRACAARVADSDAVLGLLPAGTGNLLARNLGLPLTVPEAIAVLASPTLLDVDVVELDGVPFVVMAGTGIDALMFTKTNEGLKGRVGWLAYAAGAVAAVRQARPHRVQVTIDGVTHRMRAVGVVVGNVGTLTAGLQLLPDADADDGQVHVAVLTAESFLDWVGLGTRLLARKAPQPQHMRVLRGTTVEIAWSRELPAEIDGDLVEARRCLRFQTLPGKLTVCTPSRASDVSEDRLPAGERTGH
jgi:YegS/Rv2252/BmrU family lipid kinase